MRFLFVFIISILSSQTKSFPAAKWLYYKDINESGFSQDSLIKLEAQLKTMATSAYLIIHEGRIVYHYGEIARNFRLASMRKSLMNGLIGKLYDQKKLTLNTTLKDLNIDDIGKLSEKEKASTVKNLLTSTSNIYHMSAHMPRDMKKNIPERHSESKKWFYNNWDFNVLSTIYNQLSASDLFEDFQRDFAIPLQMEDFSLSQSYYRKEPSLSMHPAYLFRMSARDIARYGLLYLNNGEWNKQNILSKEWIDMSTSSQVKDLADFENRGDYAFLWWTFPNTKYGKLYYASGLGGLRMCIYPDKKIILVHMINNYEGRQAGAREVFNVLFRSLAAQTEEATSKPKLERFKLKKAVLENKVDLSEYDFSKYLGRFSHKFLGKFTISQKGKHLMLEGNIGKFKLFSLTKDCFIPEDILTELKFVKSNGPETKNTIKTVYKRDRLIDHIIFYY